jgi:hypothetical protein
MDSTIILMWIADICGVIGMSYFLYAEIRQLLKVKKTHKITGISKTAYISKLKAISFTSIMLVITALYMSLAVILAEGIIVAWVLFLMKRYKKVKK